MHINYQSISEHVAALGLVMVTISTLKIEHSLLLLSDRALGIVKLQFWYNNNNNNNNNNHDDIYSAVIYGASHTREFTAVHLGQSRSAPGGHQLAGQAANLTFESACRLP